MKYRVGKKNKNAILHIETGEKYLVFPKNSNKNNIQSYCDWLNNKEVNLSKFEVNLSKFEDDLAFIIFILIIICCAALVIF